MVDNFILGYTFSDNCVSVASFLFPLTGLHVYENLDVFQNFFVVSSRNGLEGDAMELTG